MSQPKKLRQKQNTFLSRTFGTEPQNVFSNKEITEMMSFLTQAVSHQAIKHSLKKQV